MLATGYLAGGRQNVSRRRRTRPSVETLAPPDRPTELRGPRFPCTRHHESSTRQPHGHECPGHDVVGRGPTYCQGIV